MFAAILKPLALAVLSTSLSAPARPATAGNIQLALDKLVEFDIPNSPIDEAFAKLTRATGVQFVIDPAVYACMPYGDQTRLGMKVKGYTLREALSPMLARQAMEWVLSGSAVRIQPAPALLRMTRRATYKELEVLGRMYSMKAKKPDGKDIPGVIDQLRTAAKNDDLTLVLHPQDVQGDADAEAAAIQRANRVLPGTPAAWLDFLCHGKGWTWYLWGDNILIIPRERQIERQLQQTVTLRYDNAKLVTVLLDLAKQARVKLNMDPGVMDLIPAETREHFNLRMAEATIAQALEVIGGATGLEFVREPEGLTVRPSKALEARIAAGIEAAQKKTPFFLKKTVRLPDGSSIDLLLRPDDLPADVLEAIQAERAALYELLIRKYRTTTQPATKPAR